MHCVSGIIVLLSPVNSPIGEVAEGSSWGQWLAGCSLCCLLMIGGGVVEVIMISETPNGCCGGGGGNVC